MKKEKFIKLTLKIFLCVFFLASYSGHAIAQPEPSQQGAAIEVSLPPPPLPVKLALPPPGKIWARISGKWTLVIAPPADVPYIWRGNGWVIAPPPAVDGYEWVPGYWSAGYWYPAHWAVLAAPGPGMAWFPGRWEGHVWRPGYWGGPHPHGHVWAPGYRDRAGIWHRGRWGNPPGPAPHGKPPRKP